MINLSIDRQLVDDDYEDDNGYMNPEQVQETFDDLSAALDRIAVLGLAGYGYSLVGPIEVSPAEAALKAAVASGEDLPMAAIETARAAGVPEDSIQNILTGADGAEIVIDGQTDVDMVEVVGTIKLTGASLSEVWDAMPYEAKDAMEDLRYSEFRSNLLEADVIDQNLLDDIDTFLQNHDRFWAVVDPDGDDEGNPVNED